MALGVLISTAGATEFYGPSHYYERGDSPFLGIDFDYFHLEDFEDALLNTPGVSASRGSATSVGYGPDLHDSVDGDDGRIDGSGLDGDSFFARNAYYGLRFTFSANALGNLPTYAGVVWTDGDQGKALFQAYGPADELLGYIGPVEIGDDSNEGTTEEDRFFGVHSPGGILRIIISSSEGGIEIDHLQYGRERLDNAPRVSLRAPLNITEESATLVGYLDDDGGLPCEIRFSYWVDPLDVKYTPWQAAMEDFSVTLSELSRGARYSFYAEARNSAASSASSTDTFITLGPQVVITVSSGPGGSIITPGEGVYELDRGESFSLSARAKPFHGFAGWSSSAPGRNGLSDTSAENLTLVAEVDCTLHAGFSSYLTVIHVDDDAPRDPVPFSRTVSDPDENGTQGRPFDAIQEAIAVALPGCIIRVHGGTYFETLDLLGKGIDLVGSDPTGPDPFLAFPVIDANNAGTAVTFNQNEGADCRLTGFVIIGGRGDPGAILCDRSSPYLRHCIVAGNRCTTPDLEPQGDSSLPAAIYCHDSNAVFENCTIYGNETGRETSAFRLDNCPATVITNSILWGNGSAEILVGFGPDPMVTYCTVMGGWPGPGNISADPRFAAPGAWIDVHYPAVIVEPNDPLASWRPGDYHLMSTAGRWDPSRLRWVIDLEDSPCIDAGDPKSSWQWESAPHGGHVNQGAYGNSPQASLSASD
jgi:hypothetical protein